MKLEIRYRMIDWWTDHIRLEIRRSSDSREERIVLSLTLRRRKPSGCQQTLDRYLREILILCAPICIAIVMRVD